ncbi:MAG: radical SAM protein [Proteobacteria bacterium]|nr:radical SAM protein [Pseudomonadota bacterium]
MSIVSADERIARISGVMKDWSTADWVDPELNWQPLPVTELPERVLMDYATKCNLRCPMCPVWGSDDEGAIDSVKGLMDIEKARKVLDELMAVKPLVQPCVFGEPMLIPDLIERIRELKARGMTIAINTNGLTLTDRVARQLVEEKVDSVFFSLDSVTPETLMKIRGIDKLEKIEAAVFRLLAIRGNAERPRIGATFTVQDGNRHEEQAFVDRWVGVVDCVRTGIVFENGTFPDMIEPLERKPCPAMYKTLVVHNDGTVTVCCLDGFKITNMGNVFEEGVKEVWQGEEFAKARYYHETGQWDKVTPCTNCNGWAQYEFEEEVRDGLLIRRSPQFNYYNRIDRLNNWQGRLLGGHESDTAETLRQGLLAAE